MRTIRASLAVVAITLLSASGAGAQEAVSNLGIGTEMGTSNFESWSSHLQAFVTGNHDRGYDLVAFRIEFDTGTANVSDLSVELWSASGTDPDASLADFTVPGTALGTGVTTFNAPAGTTLDANTRYFAYVNYAGSTDRPSWRTTGSNSETSTLGWTIHDNRTRSGNDTTWNNLSAWSLLLAVDATESNASPTVDIITTNPTVEAGAQLELEATANDDTGIASYAWTGAGSFSPNSSPTTGNTTWTAPSEAQTYTLTLTVTDDDGVTASDTVSVIVNASANPAPTVNITSTSRTIDAGSDVFLQATASDDGTIASYDWSGAGSFSPSSSTTTGNTTWTAPSPTSLLTYTLTLTVTDDDSATASDSIFMTVRAANTDGDTPSGGGGTDDTTGGGGTDDRTGGDGADDTTGGDSTDDTVPVPALPLAGSAILALILVLRGARRVNS